MKTIQVTRELLRKACKTENWNFLDKLLETDNSMIDDEFMFSDIYGDYWGLLMECIYRNSSEGVTILLKHGANREIGRWGDNSPQSPHEAAAENLLIIQLLETAEPPKYHREKDPKIPE